MKEQIISKLDVCLLILWVTEVEMTSRLKEEEKNERIIRGLLKLTPNRRCINCNGLGPQYVCTNFWTFVCTNCSGIHREFTHRVKSISMAKFTAQEVSALQEGGNQCAKETYFKDWDPQRHSLPDSSNVDRLRDFIRHVYVDRRFTGEKSFDKPPRVKGDKDDFNENRRMETYQGGPKSPPYEDSHERHYSDRSSPGGRSPGYDQERQYGDSKRSPGRPQIINDWRREDRFGDDRKFDDHRISNGDNKFESQSPERASDLDSSSPPPVARPVRDILGENVIPPRISEPPKTNSRQAPNGSALSQRTASSSSLASSNGTPAEVKLETPKSLIDFDDDPEPPLAPGIPQTQQNTAAQLVNPTKSGDNNWASFDIAPEAKASLGHSNVNPLDSMLSQLSVPASLPAQVFGAQGPVVGSALTAAAAGEALTLSSFSNFPVNVASVTASGFTMASPVNNVGQQWASLQYQQPLFTATVSQPTVQQSTPPVGGALNNQPWNISSVPSIQGHPSTPMPHGSTSSVVLQPSTVNIKPSGRNELPQDLFTVNYLSFPAPVPGWQMSVPPGMGTRTPVQYNNVASIPSFRQPSISTNPFDVSNGSTQAPTFPSMSSLQGVLPSVTPSATMHPSNMGNLSLAWNPPPSSSYAPMMPPHAPTLASAVGPRAYMEQQVLNHVPMPRHGIGTLGTEGAAFGFSNIDQQLAGRWPASATTSNPFPSAGGNPFG